MLAAKRFKLPLNALWLVSSHSFQWPGLPNYINIEQADIWDANVYGSNANGYGSHLNVLKIKWLHLNAKCSNAIRIC